MKPQVFSIGNALEIVPDARRRILSSEARKFAEASASPRKHWRIGATYWDRVVIEHERIVWVDAFEKRRARLLRMAHRK